MALCVKWRFLASAYRSETEGYLPESSFDNATEVHHNSGSGTDGSISGSKHNDDATKEAVWQIKFSRT